MCKLRSSLVWTSWSGKADLWWLTLIGAVETVRWQTESQSSLQWNVIHLKQLMLLSYLG